MKDKSLMENLIKTLQYECKTYQKVLKAAEEKTDCLITNNIAALSNITEKESKEAERAAQLNTLREQLIASICEETGQSFKTFTLAKLIETVDEPYKKQLADCRQSIGNVLVKLLARNGINQKLLENSVKYIDFSLQLMSSPGSAVQTYGKSGQEVTNSPNRSVLDLKY